MDLDELNFMNPQGDGDSAINRFYEKLSDLSSTWIMLEDQHYRNVEQGDLDLGAIEAFKEWPQLNYFYCTHARNGGPIGTSNFYDDCFIGFLTKDYILLVGQKTPKNQVFLFDAYGRYYKTLFVSDYSNS